MLNTVQPITPPIMACWRIYPSFLERFWHLVEPTLTKAEALGEGECTVASLVRDITSGVMQLWIIWDPHAKKEPDDKESILVPQHLATYITSVQTLENGQKRLWVEFINGRHYKRWTSLFLDSLRSYAKETGCDYVSAMTRRGFVKTLVQNGCRESHVVVSIEV
jgi:hypothetical protein